MLAPGAPTQPLTRLWWSLLTRWQGLCVCSRRSSALFQPWHFAEHSEGSTCGVTFGSSALPSPFQWSDTSSSSAGTFSVNHSHQPPSKSGELKSRFHWNDGHEMAICFRRSQEILWCKKTPRISSAISGQILLWFELLLRWHRLKTLAEPEIQTTSLFKNLAWVLTWISSRLGDKYQNHCWFLPQKTEAIVFQ